MILFAHQQFGGVLWDDNDESYCIRRGAGAQPPWTVCVGIIAGSTVQYDDPMSIICPNVMFTVQLGCDSTSLISGSYIAFGVFYP
jgi:hypothetical protein